MKLVEPAPAPPPFEVPVTPVKDAPDPETKSGNPAHAKSDKKSGQAKQQKHSKSDDQNKTTQVEKSETTGDGGSTDSAGTETPVSASTDPPPVSE